MQKTKNHKQRNSYFREKGNSEVAKLTSILLNQKKSTFL